MSQKTETKTPETEAQRLAREMQEILAERRAREETKHDKNQRLLASQLARAVERFDDLATATQRPDENFIFHATRTGAVIPAVRLLAFGAIIDAIVKEIKGEAQVDDADVLTAIDRLGQRAIVEHRQRVAKARPAARA